MNRSRLQLCGLILAGSLPCGVLAEFTAGAPVPNVAAPAKPSAKPKAPAVRESALAKVVLEHFSTWDADADGKISPQEVEREILNPANQSDAAAALAALHGRFWKAELEQRKPLGREFFTTLAAPHTGPAAKPTTATENDGETSAERTPRAPGVDDDQDSEKDLNVRFSRARQSLSGAVRTLFDADGPNLPDCKQGAIGDCFLLAPLGGYVHNDGESVKKMIEPLSGTKEGWYRVRFASGELVELPPFTDSELALGGASMRGGLWVRVLEKAFGTRKLKPEDREDQVARDEIGKGGSGASTIRILTGHQTLAVKLVGDWTRPVEGQPVNIAPPPAKPPMPTPVAAPATAPGPAKPTTEMTIAEFEKILSQLRRQLPIALAAKRLVVAGTPASGVPTSISPRHAYAVFGFDPATDRITLWNPHASTFAPKGAEGFKFGYKRDKGMMTLPLVEFARIFRGVNFETEKPITGPLK